jgi:hypothetical protein
MYKTMQEPSLIRIFSSFSLVLYYYPRVFSHRLMPFFLFYLPA